MINEGAAAVGANCSLGSDAMLKIAREMREKIDENKRDADEQMVMGVPTIYFNEFRVHGVQSPDIYRDIIKKHLLN